MACFKYATAFGHVFACCFVIPCDTIVEVCIIHILQVHITAGNCDIRRNFPCFRCRNTFYFHFGNCIQSQRGEGVFQNDFLAVFGNSTFITIQIAFGYIKFVFAAARYQCHGHFVLFACFKSVVRCHGPVICHIEPGDTVLCECVVHSLERNSRVIDGTSVVGQRTILRCVDIFYFYRFHNFILTIEEINDIHFFFLQINICGFAIYISIIPIIVIYKFIAFCGFCMHDQSITVTCFKSIIAAHVHAIVHVIPVNTVLGIFIITVCQFHAFCRSACSELRVLTGNRDGYAFNFHSVDFSDFFGNIEGCDEFHGQILFPCIIHVMQTYFTHQINIIPVDIGVDIPDPVAITLITADYIAAGWFNYYRNDITFTGFKGFIIIHIVTVMCILTPFDICDCEAFAFIFCIPVRDIACLGFI